MRWSDLYLGLVGVTLGFGALVVGLEGAPWFGPIALVALAAMALVVMVGRVARTPKVLVVGDPGRGRLFRLHDALDDEGFELRSCAGPARRRCPVFDGKPCPVGDHLAAAVISNPASYRGAAPPCGEALGVVTVTVQDGSVRPLSVGRGSVLVGTAEGPAAAARAVRELIRRTHGEGATTTEAVSS